MHFREISTYGKVGFGATVNKKNHLFGLKANLFWATQWGQIISENILSVIFDKTIIKETLKWLEGFLLNHIGQ